MYIDNDDFSVWMQKLYAKLEELCKDVRVLRNADKVLPEDDNLLDNQDLLEKPLNFDPFGHARFAHLFVLYD